MHVWYKYQMVYVNIPMYIIISSFLNVLQIHLITAIYIKYAMDKRQAYTIDSFNTK